MEKKLQRDTTNKVIGGVCSGLANYFNIDAALLRVLFVLMFLCASAGFWLYIILWIVMPAGQGIQNEASHFVSSDDTTEVSEETQSDSVKSPKPKGSLVAGLILIGIGAIGLLHKYIPEINWDTAWPILLILLGLFLIIPFNSKKS
jgi:phage shock protein PspC (stress-responsive transcriptional regulator)